MTIETGRYKFAGEADFSIEENNEIFYEHDHSIVAEGRANEDIDFEYDIRKHIVEKAQGAEPGWYKAFFTGVIVYSQSGFETIDYDADILIEYMSIIKIW